MDRDVLDFLLFAKRATYAGHGAFVDSSRPDSHDLACRRGDLFYYDTYLGTEFFTGEEAVWRDRVPLWAMNYSGRVTDKAAFDGDFLKAALWHAPEEMPVRGPRCYMEGSFLYVADITGDMTWFRGYESIRYSDRVIYECYFHGGAVR